MCLLDVAVPGSEFVKGASVEGPGGAGLDTDWELPLLPPIKAEVTFVHLGTGLPTKLGDIVGARFEALDVALLVAQT